MGFTHFYLIKNVGMQFFGNTDSRLLESICYGSCLFTYIFCLLCAPYVLGYSNLGLGFSIEFRKTIVSEIKTHSEFFNSTGEINW